MEPNSPDSDHCSGCTLSSMPISVAGSDGAVGQSCVFSQVVLYCHEHQAIPSPGWFHRRLDEVGTAKSVSVAMSVNVSYWP